LAHNYIASNGCIFSLSRPTVWLSGSGGTDKTPYQLSRILAKRACAEWRSRCPLEPVLGGLLHGVYSEFFIQAFSLSDCIPALNYSNMDIFA
jgi:hypothetical protein